MKKSNRKGFTLVELVVVIAIIGILAAILVPTMMNYVKKAKLKSANSNAKLVFTTANNKAADIIADGGDADDIVGFRGTPAADASNPLKDAVYKALKDNGDGIGQCMYAVDATTKDVIGAQWTKGSGNHVGQYPNPNTDPDTLGTFGTTIGTITGLTSWPAASGS